MSRFRYTPIASALLCGALAGCSTGEKIRLGPGPAEARLQEAAAEVACSAGALTAEPPVEEPTPPPPPSVVRSGSPAERPPAPGAAETLLTSLKTEKAAPAVAVTVAEVPRLPGVEEPAVVAVLRAHLDDRPADALEKLSALPAENRDALQALIPAVARLAGKPLSDSDSDEVSVLLEQLQGVADRLQARAALRTAALCFCSRVRDFGAYEPLPEPYRFRSGEFAELYVELRNVACVPAGRRGFATHLKSSLELRDAAGQSVWRSDCETPDATRSVRRDYFLNYRFAVPNVPPGVYTLGVQITDQPTRRVVRRSLEVRVRAPHPAGGRQEDRP